MRKSHCSNCGMTGHNKRTCVGHKKKAKSSKKKAAAHSKKSKKRPRLGSGERFAQLESALEKRGVRNPAALAASIGRRNYGVKRFQQLAASGKRRALT